MATRTRVAIGVLAIVALAGAIAIGGWLGGDDDGPARPVEWYVERQLGPKEARLLAPIEYCITEETRFGEPIVDYEGDRAYVELRLAPEEDEDPGGCFLNLPILHTKLTLERNLDELTLFDSSTDPPERRWPRERPRSGSEAGRASRYRRESAAIESDSDGFPSSTGEAKIPTCRDIRKWS